MTEMGGIDTAFAYLLAKMTDQPVAAEDVARAAHLAARYLGARGRYQEAEDVFRQVLAVRKRFLGDVDPDTLSTRNEVAWMLGRQGLFPRPRRCTGRFWTGGSGSWGTPPGHAVDPERGRLESGGARPFRGSRGTVPAGS